ncbi:MAG: cell division protein [Spirochaetes bacterium]|nr:MAG: cell division protein [Spirochaetota bacterium]
MIPALSDLDTIKLGGNAKTRTLEGLAAHPGRSFAELLDSGLDGEEAPAVEEAPRMNARDGKTVDKKLMNVCIEMESIFVARMLKEMKKTVPKGEILHGGYAEEVFEDMLYDEYSMSVSKTSNLGLAKMLYSQLSNR